MWWRVLIGVAVALVVGWVALVAYVFAVRPNGSLLVGSARILPDTLRLIRRLATDRAVPRGARVRLWLLAAYLASPVDLIPDIIPVIGYADDAVLVAATLRSVIRRAGLDAVERHWPGTEDGLAVLLRMVGMAKP